MASMSFDQIDKLIYNWKNSPTQGVIFRTIFYIITIVFGPT